MPGPGDLWAWLQSLGPGPGNVGPVNGFLPDPTQTPPNPRGDGPPDVMSPAAMYAAQASPRPAPIDPYGLTRAPSPPPFNWLTSTGAGMSAPPPATPGPAAAPITPYDRRAPTGPLAAPSGQGGIGSDYAASARNIPLKRRAGAPNLGYYAPTTGNARQAQPMTYTDPNDPRIFRG
jgi:hypothetical protein